eukprot:14738-Heterococcus_DN1.PRE.1
MELIQFEKKQLIQQWKSALIGLARRDEALTAATNALREAEGAARDYDTEIEVACAMPLAQFTHSALILSYMPTRISLLVQNNMIIEFEIFVRLANACCYCCCFARMNVGLKRDIVRAQAENETLAAIRGRLDNEGKYAEEQLLKIKRSLTQMEEEESKVNIIQQQLKQQVALLSQNVQVVTRERQKLEKEAITYKDQQTTAGKAITSLSKQKASILAQCHEKEIEEANLQNELARIKVDSLNTEAHNVQLKDTLEQLETELTARDNLIAKYQLEIRQRTDEIEKKMYRVDRLNRKYEKLVESANDSNAEADNDTNAIGPLEATIKNLQKE